MIITIQNWLQSNNLSIDMILVYTCFIIAALIIVGLIYNDYKAIRKQANKYN